MMSTRQNTEIQYLASLMVERLTQRVIDAPGDRAVLRRMVGHPPTHPSARPVHSVVYHCLRAPSGAPLDLPEGLAPEWAFYGVAALIAAQPRDARDEDGAADSDGQDHDAGAAPNPDEAALPGSDDASEPGIGSDGRPRPRQEEARSNLGVSLAQGVHAGRLNADTTESRLHRLCRLDLAGVHKRLPALVRQARSQRVPIDWAVLIQDLARWDTERDLVAKQWLQSYHCTRNRDLYLEEKKRAADAASPEDSEQ